MAKAGSGFLNLPESQARALDAFLKGKMESIDAIAKEFGRKPAFDLFILADKITARLEIADKAKAAGQEPDGEET